MNTPEQNNLAFKLIKYISKRYPDSDLFTTDIKEHSVKITFKVLTDTDHGWTESTIESTIQHNPSTNRSKYTTKILKVERVYDVVHTTTVCNLAGYTTYITPVD